MENYEKYCELMNVEPKNSETDPVFLIWISCKRDEFYRDGIFNAGCDLSLNAQFEEWLSGQFGNCDILLDQN